MEMKTLEEVAIVLDSKRKPIKKGDRVPGGYPYYGASGIADYINDYRFEGVHLLLSEDGDNLKTQKTPVAFLADGKFWVNNHAHVLKANEENLTEYICYALQVADIKSYISGSTRPKITQGDMRKIQVSIPPLQEQKRIAHILGTLDDKIELNRKMNETLEAMAQALFKSWFVDFDPVIDNALATGNEIPEQFKERARSRSVQAKKGKFNHLFPSSFTFNETLNKWIPEGWEVTNLKECLDTISKTYNLKEKGEIIFLNTGDIEEGKFLHNNLSAVKGLPGQAKKSIQKGDILYSEIRPKNKRFAFVYFDSSEYVVSTKLMVLRPKNEIDSLFYYQILKSESTITELQFLAESRSGTFPQITFDTLSAIEFSLPNESKIIEEYVKQLKEIFNKSIQNIEAVESLTKTRDTLLPKLISGQIAA